MPDLALLLPLLGLVAVSAAVLAGLLGIGGGVILVTAFFYGFQSLGYGGAHLMQLCLATSLATIIVTSARSVLLHNRRGAVDWGILRGWGPGIMVGAALGVLLAANLRSEVLQALLPALPCWWVSTWPCPGRSGAWPRPCRPARFAPRWLPGSGFCRS